MSMQFTKLESRMGKSRDITVQIWGRFLPTLHRMIEDFVIKYLWSAAGYGLMSIPIFFPVATTALRPANHRVNHEIAERTEGKLDFNRDNALLLTEERLCV